MADRAQMLAVEEAAATTVEGEGLQWEQEGDLRFLAESFV